MKEEREKGDKRSTEGERERKKEGRQREAQDIERLFGDEDGSVNDARDEEGWRKRVAKCRGIENRRLVEGVGRGFGRHGDKQPPGPSQLVAGVGRKGWPRASAGQVRLGTQPECHSVQGNTRMSFGCDGEQSECDEEGGRRRWEEEENEEEDEEVEVTAAGETAAAQDGRRRDTHHVNNTLLQRKPTPSRPAPTSGYPLLLPPSPLRVTVTPAPSSIARPHSRLS